MRTCVQDNRPTQWISLRCALWTGLLVLVTMVSASAERKELVQISGSSPFDRCSADQPDRQLGMVFPDGR